LIPWQREQLGNLVSWSTGDQSISLDLATRLLGILAPRHQGSKAPCCSDLQGHLVTRLPVTLRSRFIAFGVTHFGEPMLFPRGNAVCLLGVFHRPDKTTRSVKDGIPTEERGNDGQGRPSPPLTTPRTWDVRWRYTQRARWHEDGIPTEDRGNEDFGRCVTPCLSLPSFCVVLGFKV
jgi:hypothetical protein